MFIQDPGSEFFPSRITDPESKRFPDHGSGSASKKFCILTQKIVSKISEIRSGMFIPELDLGSGSRFFYPSQIQGPKGTGSRIQIRNTDSRSDMNPYPNKKLALDQHPSNRQHRIAVRSCSHLPAWQAEWAGWRHRPRRSWASWWRARGEQCACALPRLWIALTLVRWCQLSAPLPAFNSNIFITN